MMSQQGGVQTNMAGSPGGASDPSTFSLGGAPVGHGPSGPGPSFNPGLSRMGQKNMMLPPTPSPGMNGPKDQNGGPVGAGAGGPNNQNGKNQNQGQGGGNNATNNDGSPRNQPPNAGNNAGQTPNASGTGPPTPAPGSQQQQNQGPGSGQNMAPSPTSILGGPPSLSDQLSPNIFSTDFIQSVASSLDEFEQVFRPDGDINFERDFGQWFNQDAMGGGSLDSLK